MSKSPSAFRNRSKTENESTFPITVQQEQCLPLILGNIHINLQTGVLDASSKMKHPIIMDPQTREKLEAFLDSKGVRRTTQREAIIEAAFGTTDHFTAEQLLILSRQRDESVSRATVYRTIPLLVESGLIKELDFGKGYKFYDPNYATHPHHNHLICMDCDKIVEFEDPVIELREEEISRSLGFVPTAKQVQIRANCQELKNKGVCSNKSSCDKSE